MNIPRIPAPKVGKSRGPVLILFRRRYVVGMANAPVPAGKIAAGGYTTLADEAAREIQIEASIADMILADVLAMNWRLVITCLNPECGHGAEPSMSQIAVGFRRALGNTVAELASRMHCKACGGRRLKVMNRQGSEFSYYAAGGAEARDAAFREWLAGVYASEDGGGT